MISPTAPTVAVDFFGALWDRALGVVVLDLPGPVFDTMGGGLDH